MGHYIQWTRGPGTRGPWSRDPGTRDLGPGTQGSKLACTVHVHTVDSNLLAVNGNICSTCTLRYHVYLSPNLVKIFESRLRLHGSKHKNVISNWVHAPSYCCMKSVGTMLYIVELYLLQVYIKILTDFQDMSAKGVMWKT